MPFDYKTESWKKELAGVEQDIRIAIGSIRRVRNELDAEQRAGRAAHWERVAKEAKLKFSLARTEGNKLAEKQAMSKYHEASRLKTEAEVRVRHLQSEIPRLTSILKRHLAKRRALQAKLAQAQRRN